MSTLEPHRARDVAESFGGDAAGYDRARPRYPDALLADVLDDLPGAEVLDVGCGTGIVARQLRAAGATVLGVEPDARMAALARDHGVPVEIASFETWDPAGRTFDAVVAGQTWHWVDPVAGLRQAARVLRPGGRWAVFWNAARTPDAVAEAFATAHARVAPDSGFDLRSAGDPAEAYRRFTARLADGVRDEGGFGEPQRWDVGWERTVTRAAWLDEIATHGTLTSVDEDARRAVLDAVGAAIDTLGGTITLAGTTVALAAHRT